jgi:hypothetical protein
MSTNNATQNSSPGFFNQITSAVSGAVNTAKKAVTSNNTKKNNSAKVENATALPVTANVNVPVMKGGVAPVNFRYPANMQQPSEAVMEWATTAGAPMPPASEMRNVAHGGKRRTRKHKSARKHRSRKHKSTHKRHSRRRSSKTHRRTHHRRR